MFSIRLIKFSHFCEVENIVYSLKTLVILRIHNMTGASRENVMKIKDISSGGIICCNTDSIRNVNNIFSLPW